jgi:alkylation response protein AidB-like acyl-CoA dehydrogenase
MTMTLGMVGPTFLELGTDEQKTHYIPRMLRGDDIWIQFLSEPTGGSDLASALTRANRDRDEWVINGSKIWTSQADFSDIGLCIARTNWDVPKHRGLTMFIVPVRSPGLTVLPLRLVSGQTGFCQEFFDDVRIPLDSMLGSVDQGWSVASRLLTHERNTVGGGSPFFHMASSMQGIAPDATEELIDLARRHDQHRDPHVRQLVMEAYVASTVEQQLGPRIAEGTEMGHLPVSSGSLLKLFATTHGTRRADIGMAIAGHDAVAWRMDDETSRDRGVGYLSRQAMSILSGTTEIQRNIVSERVLGLPREQSVDRDVPFREVRHNTMPAPDPAG